jgi:hypothetical protein
MGVSQPPKRNPGEVRVLHGGWTAMPAPGHVALVGGSRADRVDHGHPFPAPPIRHRPRCHRRALGPSTRGRSVNSMLRYFDDDPRESAPAAAAAFEAAAARPGKSRPSPTRKEAFARSAQTFKGAGTRKQRRQTDNLRFAKEFANAAENERFIMLVIDLI